MTRWHLLRNISRLANWRTSSGSVHPDNEHHVHSKSIKSLSPGRKNSVGRSRRSSVCSRETLQTRRSSCQKWEEDATDAYRSNLLRGRSSSSTCDEESVIHRRIGVGPGVPIIAPKSPLPATLTFRPWKNMRWGIRSWGTRNMSCFDVSQFEGLYQFMEHWAVKILFAVLTIYAIFGIDLMYITVSKSSDIYFQYFSFFTMVLFAAELVCLSLCKPGYFLSLQFFLDFVAMASMINDVPWLSGTAFLGQLTVARASRMSKIFRMTKIFRLARLASAMQRISDHQTFLSEHITRNFVQKILFIALMMMTLIPILTIVNTDSNSLQFLDELHSLSGAGANSTALYDQRRAEFIQQYDNMRVLKIRDVSYLSLSTSDLRIQELLIETRPATSSKDSAPTRVELDVSEAFKMEILYGMLIILLVIIVLVVGSWMFGRDSTRTAKPLGESLGRISMDMAGVAEFVFLPIEHKQIPVYEMQVILRSFLGMKRSISSFAKYVPSEVVRSLMKGGLEARLGVVERDITMMFTDIANFTTICEKVDPKELLIVLSEYFEAMATIIRESGGTLAEFIGDAILAFWNAPEEVDDHPFAAVNAGQLMHDSVEEQGVEWRERGFPEMKIRIGVHTAKVFVGNIGSEYRMKYGVLGDGVNLTSRLEELNKRYDSRLLLSGDCLNASERVRTEFLFRQVDVVVVKGRSDPTKLYQVFDRRRKTTDSLKEMVKIHESAMWCYMQRDFDGCIDLLRKVESIKPGDKSAVLFRERCRRYIEKPPSEEWKGVDVLKEKHF
eukprot:972481_1